MDVGWSSSDVESALQLAKLTSRNRSDPKITARTPSWKSLSEQSTEVEAVSFSLEKTCTSAKLKFFQLCCSFYMEEG